MNRGGQVIVEQLGKAADLWDRIVPQAKKYLTTVNAAVMAQGKLAGNAAIDGIKRFGQASFNVGKIFATSMKGAAASTGKLVTSLAKFNTAKLVAGVGKLGVAWQAVSNRVKQAIGWYKFLNSAQKRPVPPVTPGGAAGGGGGGGEGGGIMSHVSGIAGAAAGAHAAMMGAVATASPDAIRTFSGSLEMVTITLGKLFLPAIVKVSIWIQKVNYWLEKWIGRFSGTPAQEVGGAGRGAGGTGGGAGGALGTPNYAGNIATPAFIGTGILGGAWGLKKAYQLSQIMSNLASGKATTGTAAVAKAAGAGGESFFEKYSRLAAQGGAKSGEAAGAAGAGGRGLLARIGLGGGAFLTRAIGPAIAAAVVYASHQAATDLSEGMQQRLEGPITKSQLLPHQQFMASVAGKSQEEQKKASQTYLAQHAERMQGALQEFHGQMGTGLTGHFRAGLSTLGDWLGMDTLAGRMKGIQHEAIGAKRIRDELAKNKTVQQVSKEAVGGGEGPNLVQSQRGLTAQFMDIEGARQQAQLAALNANPMERQLDQMQRMADRIFQGEWGRAVQENLGTIAENTGQQSQPFVENRR